MSNIFDKFRDSAVGSSGRILDFTSKINSSGDFTKVYDLNAIILSWNNILITQKGTYDHDPEYGSNLYLYLFEPADDKTQQSIKDEIKNSLSVYDSRANIDDIAVNFLSNQKGFSVNITADYFGVKGSLSVTIDNTTYENYM
jgi:phage baseplate assembly protein W